MTITNKTILIIGGTGMLGKPVAQQLKADGFNVRLLARNPEKAQKLLGAGYEIVKGDVDNAAALREAMIGVDGVHISLKGGPTEADYDRMDHLAVRDIANIAKELGVGRVTIFRRMPSARKRLIRQRAGQRLRAKRHLNPAACRTPSSALRGSWRRFRSSYKAKAFH
ncbi:MAG: NAD(P)H-binding protein [Anaerolineales bacterium]|nr:NAD(P)H-binding protein [Anaerolineales bacterium]